jgi:hypothetical protein
MRNTPRRNRSIEIAWVLALLFLRLSVGAVPPAYAAASTCGSNVHYWDGTKVFSPNPSTSAYIDGADGFIQVRHADLCTSQSNAFSYAYSMVSVPGAGKLAQVGWTNYAALCCLRFQWEWFANSSTLYTAYWGSPSLGTSYDFEVQTQSDGKLHMYENSGVPPCNQAGQCPVTSWVLHNQGTSSNAQFYGEVNYPGSDVPGTDTNRATFFISELWNGVWGHYAWNGLSSGCSYYKYDNLISNSEFDTYTKPTSPPRTC